MELSKRNLIIVGGIILVLLLGIVILGRKPKTKPVVTNPTPGQDFNVVEKKDEVVVFNTPTPTPTLIPTKIPTSTPTLTPTLTPTPTPTSIPSPTPTARIIPTRRPTRVPTATPTPDNSIKATGVSLSTTELTLAINQTHQILSKVEPNDTTDKSVSWSSSDGNIATVDSNGNVTGKNLGETLITAKTSNGKTTIVRVTVINTSEPITQITSEPVVRISIYPQNIRLNYTTVNLKVGEKEQLRLDIKPVDVTDYSTRWSSSDSSVAIVSIWGMVTAKSPGNTIITAKTVNGLIETATITVAGGGVLPPNITPTSRPTQKLTPVSTTKPTATPTKKPTATPTKKPTATPTKKPTATPTKKPTATPTKKPTPTYKPISTPTSVEIIEVTGIIINKTEISLKINEAQQIEAIIQPSNATNKEIDWSSSNGNVAVVSIWGMVTAKSPGTTIISAKTVNGLVETARITVKAEVLPSSIIPTATPTKKPTATPTRQPTSYVLVWSDEFNGNSLDTSKWTATANCHDNWNQEQQCYTADAVSVSGGNLIIKSERRKIGSYNFTSGLVKSDGSTSLNGIVTAGPIKYTFKYGRIEFRVKLPAGGQGIWPALWLIPPPYNNPPEVDIIEGFSDMSNIYTNYWYKEAGIDKQAPISFKISSPSTTFHIFTFEWEPGVFRWYFDGDLKRTLASPIVTDIPMYILMNTALGGKGTGPVDISTPFPQYFLIDYVRVYQKQ